MLDSGRGTGRLRALVVGSVLALVLATSPPPVVGGTASGDEHVVLSAEPGREQSLRAVVEALGGTVTARLPVVDGLTATVPSGAVAQLRSHPAVRGLSTNDPVRVQSDPADGGGGPQSVYRQVIGADALAADGGSGRGVTVALVDTGVDPVPDVADRLVAVTDPFTGRTERCVDFSGEGHCGDSYGHGTFMAGIIAGDGRSSEGRWTGVAPGADLVSLKVAGRDGSSDVSKVLAAIQWAVSFKDRYGIDVLNLSLGTDSIQSWDVDPFNYAVERAWQAGIVVTVAASNRGPQPGTISKPGDDPWVLTVGAIDDHGTPATADDRLPDFSSRGPTAHGVAKPDVVAPGARIVSLRAPGSAIDEAFPTYIDDWYRRGSGTSMATAAVTGGVALLLERKPGWSPDQVKEALRATARPTASTDPSSVGAGLVDLAAAADGDGTTGERPGHRSSGLGKLDASRGGVRVEPITVRDTLSGALLTSGVLLWDPIGFTTGSWTASTWPHSVWATHQWQTTTWEGDNWHGDNWHGDNWHGDWEGSTVHGEPQDDSYGRPWAGAAWYGLWD